MHDFNTGAAEWAELWSGLAAPAREAVADRLRAGDRVLDIGCGSGEFCALAQARGMTASGIDVAPAMIEIARSARARRRPAGRLDGRPAVGGRRRSTRSSASTACSSPTIPSPRCASGRGSRAGTSSWSCGAPRERCELFQITAALRELAGEEAPPPGLGTRIEAVVARGRARVASRRSTSTSRSSPTRSASRPRCCGTAGSSGSTTTSLLAAIRETAAPFRRADGGYRLDNIFRVAHAIACGSEGPAFAFVRRYLALSQGTSIPDGGERSTCCPHGS